MIRKKHIRIDIWRGAFFEERRFHPLHVGTWFKPWRRRAQRRAVLRALRAIGGWGTFEQIRQAATPGMPADLFEERLHELLAQGRIVQAYGTVCPIERRSRGAYWLRHICPNLNHDRS